MILFNGREGVQFRKEVHALVQQEKQEQQKQKEEQQPPDQPGPGKQTPSG